MKARLVQVYENKAIFCPLPIELRSLRRSRQVERREPSVYLRRNMGMYTLEGYGVL